MTISPMDKYRRSGIYSYFVANLWADQLNVQSMNYNLLCASACNGKVIFSYTYIFSINASIAVHCRMQHAVFSLYITSLVTTAIFGTKWYNGDPYNCAMYFQRQLANENDLTTNPNTCYITHS